MKRYIPNDNSTISGKTVEKRGLMANFKEKAEVRLISRFVNKTSIKPIETSLITL